MSNSEELFQVSVLERPYEFSSPFFGDEFAAMIWVVDPEVSYDEQDSLSRQLIEQGCRYAVCAGHQCSKWDDSIDMAFLETDPNYDPPDENFVMTTWHEDESVEEVAEFFVLNTSFDNFVPSHFLVLFVGRDNELELRVASMVRNLFDAQAV